MSTLLYSESKPGVKEAAEFIQRLLGAVATFHMHHLSTDSYSKHEALGELYSGLGGLADSLAESFLGCTGQKMPPQGDPTAELQSLYEYIETARGKMGYESHIQNEVDSICTLIASTLYKLRNLA